MRFGRAGLPRGSGRPTATYISKARALSSATSIQLLSASAERQAHAGPIRQQVYCCPDQPPRGNPVYTATPGILEPVDLGISLPGQCAGSLHTRGTESGHRLSIVTEAPTGVVAASSEGGGDDMGSLWQGGSGPLIAPSGTLWSSCSPSSMVALIPP